MTYRKGEHREEVARKLVEEKRLTLIPPFDHPHVVAGQGTAAKELIEDAGALDELLVPCGGGGLISGCAIAARHLAPDCRVIGVEPAAGDDATRSFKEKKLVKMKICRNVNYESGKKTNRDTVLTLGDRSGSFGRDDGQADPDQARRDGLEPRVQARRAAPDDPSDRGGRGGCGRACWRSGGQARLRRHSPAPNSGQSGPPSWQASLASLRAWSPTLTSQEWDYGGYEGRTTADIRREWPGWYLWRDGVIPGDAAHPGETVAQSQGPCRRCAGEGQPTADRRRRSARRPRSTCFAHLTAPVAWSPAPGQRTTLLELDTGTLSFLGTERGRPSSPPGPCPALRAPCLANRIGNPCQHQRLARSSSRARSAGRAGRS